MALKNSQKQAPPAGDTVPRVFSQTVQRLGARTAFRERKYGIWRDISWEMYCEAVRHVTLALYAMHLKKGDRVAIIGENGPEWAFIDLGVQAAGGVSVGIYTTSAASQCEYVIAHSEAKFVFVENEEQLDKWLEIRQATPSVQKVIVWDRTGLQRFEHPQVMFFDALLEQGRLLANEKPGLFETLMQSIKPADLSMLIYTSGTTGPPKGAMLTHANVTWIARAVAEANPVYETDEVLSFLPLCHIFERLFSILVHIRFGYVVNFIENLDTVTANMREVAPTIGYGVPRVWEKYHASILIKMADATWLKRTLFHLALRIGERFAKQRFVLQLPVNRALRWQYRLAAALVFRKLRERLGLHRMRIAYSGAAPISPEILLFFQAIGLNLLEGYGQTEGSGVTTANRSTRFRLSTVGQALPGVTLKISDEGEILVQSPGVFKGYFKNPEATAETLRHGWLHSGDIGELDAGGFLRIVDRKKDLIITAGGKNVAPQHIENLLKFSPYINDAVVIGDRRKYLTAIIVIDEENVGKYAQDHKIQFSTYAQLTQHQDINRLIQREIAAVNQKLARVEQIKKFRILNKKLYEEDGEVTPTMKVKRKNIQEAYSDLIEEMYKA